MRSRKRVHKEEHGKRRSSVCRLLQIDLDKHRPASRWHLALFETLHVHSQVAGRISSRQEISARRTEESDDGVTRGRARIALHNARVLCTNTGRMENCAKGGWSGVERNVSDSRHKKAWSMRSPGLSVLHAILVLYEVWRAVVSGGWWWCVGGLHLSLQLAGEFPWNCCH